MTDDNIITALECCTRLGCLKCPLYTPDPTGSCVKRVLFGALELIHRQNRELEGLNSRIDALNDTNTRLMDSQEIYWRNRVKEFVERLETELENCHTVSDGEYNGYDSSDIYTCIENSLKEILEA